MTTQPEVIKHSELLNQIVINRDTMEELGRVEVVWMYAPSHRVLGFVGKAGFLNAKRQAFKLFQVVAIGDNGVLTQAQPEETDAEKVSQLESVIHAEVWSDAGQKIGKITDYLFNLRTGEIVRYLFVSSNFGSVMGEIYQIYPSQVLSFGRSRVLVPEYVLKDLSVYQEGIKQKLTKAGEFLKDEKQQVTQELQTLKQRAQETTQQAKGQLWNWTAQVKNRAQSLSQETREKIYGLNEQLKEETQTLVNQARERSNDWLEQVKEQTQTISEQVEDGIQTLTVQAKEILDTEEEALDQPSIADTDDPEDFFDALFKEEVETPLATTQASSSASSQNQESQAIASTPPHAKSASTTGLSIDKSTTESMEEDVWDSPVHESSASTESSPAPTASTAKQADELKQDDDEEPWV